MILFLLTLLPLWTGMVQQPVAAADRISITCVRDTVPDWVLLQMRVDRIFSKDPVWDSHAQGQKVILRLYQCGENRYCFANIFQRNNSQSYGAIYGFEPLDGAGQPDYPNSFRWLWTYLNTYDDAEGLAMVTLHYHELEPGTPFELEIFLIDASESVKFTGVFDHLYPGFEVIDD